jgi:hypothetical protein
MITRFARRADMGSGVKPSTTSTPATPISTSIAATASPRWSRAIRSCSVELLQRERGHTVTFRRMPEVGRRCICSTQSEYDKLHDIVIHAHSIPPSVDLGS